MSSLKEAFENLDALQSSFYIDQQTKYQEYEPNRLLPDKMKGNVGPSIVAGVLDNLNQYDPYTGKSTQRISGAGLGKVLQGEPDTTDAEIQARQYIGLNGLEQLIRDTADNPMNPVRPGWRYKPSRSGLVAEVAQGALGTRNGPLNNNAVEDKLGGGVIWIWDLSEAKKRMLRDIANALPTGSSLALINTIQVGALAGKFGFCVTTNRIIPILPNGRPMYPNDNTLNCSAANIITDPAKIPPPSANTNSVQAAQQLTLANLQNCATARSGTPLSRDCFLLAIKNNGCSDAGTLYQSLQLVNPAESRWDTYLRSQPSFTNYQSRQGGNGITDQLFQKSRGSWEMAVNDIARLHTASMNSRDPYVRIASSDLCTQSGKFDSYDFCSDITDSTDMTSVELKCIQGYWQQQNGKPAGKAYPTTKTLDIAMGTNIRTWGQYKKAVDDMKARTNDTDPYVQRDALYNFYGVRVGKTAFAPNNLDGTELDSSAPCLGLGKPSADNNIRVYTKEECDKMNGNYYNGECLLKTGGSYSWNCRYLNGQEPKSGLVLWLDANDGSTLTIDSKNGVRDWVDKSGMGNNIRQFNVGARPKYTKMGENATISFDGVGSFLALPNPTSLVRGYFTIFFVEQRRSNNGGWIMVGTNFGTNTCLHIGYRSSTNITFAFFNNDLEGRIAGWREGEAPRIWCLNYNNSGRSLWMNGRKVSSDRNSAGLQDWGGGIIGGIQGGFYNGNLSEILIYNPAIDTDAKRQKIEGYLANKWAITSSLDDSHPYKYVAP